MLSDLVQNKKILICCGSGGVGKTTLSAALALYAAKRGQKTLVLTIDPAKRLAQALGIESIDYRERAIPAQALKKVGVSTPLYAMMLDTKRTFDALILKYASSEEKAQGIFKNKLYQQLSSMVAGSQEYMAMEKLYEISSEGDYDLVILDTPPSRHALDFLEAPHRMRNMIEDSVMRLFLKPSLFVSRAGFKLLDRSMRRVMSAFDKVTGFEFLQDLSNFLVTTSELLEGFQERATKVENLLHDKETAILLVASPQPIPLGEAEYFFQKIQAEALPFAGFIFNRVQSVPKIGPLKQWSPSTQKELQKVEKLFRNLSERDHRELKRFRQKIEKKTSDPLFLTLPQLDHDVHDLKTLNELLSNRQ